MARAIHSALHWDVGLREMKGGMTMSRKLCSVKMTITNICGTSVSHKTMKLRPEERQELSKYGSGNSKGWTGVREKEDGKAKKYQDLFEKFEN